MEEDETQDAATIEEEQGEIPEITLKGKLSDLSAKISELAGELEAEKAKSDDYYRRLQYLQADFENYRKRAEKEVGEVKRMGNERLLSDLLLVNDELELALQRAREKNENPVLLEGVGMVHKRLQGLLAKEGGRPVVIPSAEGQAAAGKMFPSVVAFTKEGQLIVGEPAKRQAAINPEGTIFEVKRKMGTS